MSLVDKLKIVVSRIKAVNSPLLSKSTVFCMAPWIQLHAQTNGKVAPCCMAAMHSGNEIGDLKQNPNLADAWNSPNMKQLRLNMLKGEENTLCKHCYNYEKVGKFSERMQYNKDHKRYFSRISSTKKDGSLDEVKVPLIDIRFSNKCNYKCRICDSEYSTQWYEEELKINRPAKSIIEQGKEMKVSNDADAFWQSYTSLLGDVKRLHFAGGEPLFMDEHYKALEHLISIGKTDVTLSYNTNFSTLRYKKYDVVSMWNKFETVDVWASLDGMGAQGDYQRKGQKWEKIEENIRTIQRDCTSLLFGVNVTVSMLNILHIPDFYRYMVEQKLVEPQRLNLYLLFDPSYMNITNLPLAIKQKAIKQFEALDRDFLNTLPNPEHIRNHIAAVVNFMMGEQGNELDSFRHWIGAVDHVRNEDFIATFPELASLMVLPEAENTGNV
jgi:MoaA/NifB/PqqE/SkfB family radical SAM enzyme